MTIVARHVYGVPVYGTDPAGQRVQLGMTQPDPIDFQIEACTCGGAISAAAGVASSIAAAVRAHVRSERHLEWARLEGFV